MGAKLSDWEINPGAKKSIKTIEVNLSPDSISDVTQLGENAPLHINGKQVLLYIKDTNLDLDIILNNPTESRRFHIANCQTLQSMLKDGRHKRFVATNRSIGKFLVDAKERFSNEITKDVEATLYVCKNCLKALNLMTEKEFWPEFSIDGFLRDYETFFPFCSEYTDITSPPSGYTKNWVTIRDSAKTKMNYTCEECGVICRDSKTRRLIHCHHIDGVKFNNKPTNLRVLCAVCHWRQPGHGQFPPSKNDQATLEKLLADQNKE